MPFLCAKAKLKSGSNVPSRCTCSSAFGMLSMKVFMILVLQWARLWVEFRTVAEGMPLNITTGTMRACVAALNLALSAIGVLAPLPSQAAPKPVQAAAGQAAPLPAPPLPRKAVSLVMSPIANVTDGKPGEEARLGERRKLSH